MSADDDKMWTPDNPSRIGDEADDQPRVIANRLGALTRDVNAGFESIREALKTFARIEEKLDVVIDRQNVLERRQDSQAEAIAALCQRVAALEAAPPERPVRRSLPLKKRK